MPDIREDTLAFLSSVTSPVEFESVVEHLGLYGTREVKRTLNLLVEEGSVQLTRSNGLSYYSSAKS